MNICKALLKCESEVGAILSSIKFTSLQACRAESVLEVQSCHSIAEKLLVVPPAWSVNSHPPVMTLWRLNFP